MTEGEWLTSDDPEAMMTYWRARASTRKSLFFASACYQASEAWSHDYLRKNFEAFVAAMGTEPDSPEVREDAWSVVEGAAETMIASTSHADGLRIALRERWGNSPATEVGRTARKNQCKWLRDIAGNPFQQRGELPSNANLSMLAQEIFEGNAFDRLPILADALEEAGCTEEAILAHCRGPGPHVRGCWAIDLILGKQ